MPTEIQWADEVWNPSVGCTKVSAGCEHCYAMKVAARFTNHFDRSLTRTFPDGSVNWTGKVQIHEDRVTLPLRWQRPRRVFVDSMSDLWHDDVPDMFLRKVWMNMIFARQHTFIIVTKRPERARQWINTSGREVWDAMVPIFTEDGEDPLQWPIPNIWGLVSTEDQAAADARIPILLDTPFRVRGISAEPLLGPIDLSGGYLADHSWEHGVLGGLDWVIAGGESAGPPERALVHRVGGELIPKEDALEWVRSLRDQTVAAGAAFFFKQYGGSTPKAGGRLLDGRTWDQFPDKG